ncbi:MAG: gliding motility-associated-like protein, partial [Luteibaculaceae bacterium]
AFTPNADDHNEFFKPVIGTTKEILRFGFTVFDRWGEQIFATQDINQGWDGKHKGVLVKQDAYVWSLHFHVAGEETKILQGVVNVIR